MRDSNVETLLIGGALDVATPPQWATRELLPHLPNGREVVLENIGHTDDFWTYQPEAGTELINGYLATGQADASRYTPTPVDFTPALSPGAIATIVVGVMLGLAALTVLSLLWMAVRVRRRGGYGRKSSAALRSVYPVVLGLGGWFLGVLVVLTAMPGVALDDEPLALLSVGVPIGLGIYLAWVQRDRTGSARTAGLVAAMAGALVGGWLGFNATAGLVALLTTIVGATAAANLALILLELTWEQSARRSAAAESPRGSTLLGT